MKKNGVKSIAIASIVGLVLILVPMAVMIILKDNEGIQGAQASLIIAMIAGVVVIAFAVIFLMNLISGKKMKNVGRW